jgi:hypothetical protein
LDHHPAVVYAIVDRLERFRAKWAPVRVKKTRQNEKLERPVPIQSERKGLLRSARANGRHSIAAAGAASSIPIRTAHFRALREMALSRLQETRYALMHAAAA